MGLCHKQTYLFFGGGPAVNYAGYPAVGNDHYAVAKLNKNVKVLADKYYRNAVVLFLGEQVVYQIGGVDVKSAHGVSRHKDRGAGGYLASDEYLLHIAARKPSYGSGDARRYDLKLAHYLLGKVVRLFAFEEHRFAAAVAAQHHIVGYVHVSDKTHAESVLGDEGKSYSEVAYLERRFVAQIVNAACFRIVVKDLAAFK